MPVKHETLKRLATQEDFKTHHVQWCKTVNAQEKDCEIEKWNLNYTTIVSELLIKATLLLKTLIVHGKAIHGNAIPRT